jgi:hypothetical protein
MVMGSFFGRGENRKPQAPKRAYKKSLNELVPPLSREVEDRESPMTAPEVDLKGKLPAGVAERLGEVLETGGRALLANPEEEEVRWFALHEDHIEEIGRSPVAEYDHQLFLLESCRDGAITFRESRYRLEAFKAFNEFGDRLVLQFFEEGRFTGDEAIERRQENIRLVNRLKPATSLTARNELDIARTIANNPRPHSFVDILLKEEVLTPEEIDQVPAGADFELRLLQSHIFPRKVAALALAHYLEVDYIDVEAAPFSKEAARLLDKDWELEKQVVPFARDGEELKVAMADPTDAALLEELARLTECRIRPYCSAAQDIVGMIHKAHKRDD